MAFDTERARACSPEAVACGDPADRADSLQPTCSDEPESRRHLAALMVGHGRAADTAGTATAPAHPEVFRLSLHGLTSRPPFPPTPIPRFRPAAR